MPAAIDNLKNSAQCPTPDTVKKCGQVVRCIVPTHNRVDVLRTCLNRLLAQSYDCKVIYVVNDGSDDGTSEYLASACLPGLFVIEGDGKLWWGGAAERGMRQALKDADNSDYFLLMNDDAEFEDDFLSKMVNESRRSGGTVVAPQYDSLAKILRFTGYRVDYRAMQITQVKDEHINATVGRGLLVPFNIVSIVGVVNGGKFRHYMGDLEYTARIKEAGFSLTVAWDAPVYSDLAPSDCKVRMHGRLVQLFHPRSKTNIWDRLAYFSSRGPFRYRFLAPFRIAIVTGVSLMRIIVDRIRRSPVR